MLQLLVLCRAKDRAAQMASAWRLVQVQQVYSVAMTIPLTLAADNLADAQAQADLITTSSNASSGLSGALAAGLIAGGSTIPSAFSSLHTSYSINTAAHGLHATGLTAFCRPLGGLYSLRMLHWSLTHADSTWAVSVQ